MEPVPSLHLPELSKLFAGDETILSWYDVPMQELSSENCPTQTFDRWEKIFLSFFEAGATVIQTQQTPAFPPSSNDTKRRFETLTAPINTAPSTSKHHNISEIKDDTTRLSKLFNVNEEQALRVVLLEWQDRPKLRLQAGYSETEIASLKNVYASQLAFDADFEAVTFLLRDEAKFAKEVPRWQRQTYIHFRECIGFARAWLAFRTSSLNDTFRVNIKETPLLAELVELIVNEIHHLSRPVDDGERDEEMAYISRTGRLFYIGELLQSTFLAADHIDSVPSQIIKKWFECMADTQFLSGIEPSALMPQEEVRRLEYLVGLASIALLQPAKTIDQIKDSWLSDLTVVNEIQLILLNATDEQCTQAIPVAFTWSLILQDVRERGIAAKDGRDSPTATRSLDSASWDSATGRRSSVPASTQQSIYEDIIDTVLGASPLPDPISTIIQHTIEHFQVGDLIPVILKSSQGLPFIQRLKSQIVQEIIVIALNTLPDAYGPVVLQPQFAVLGPDQVDIEACNIFLQQSDLLEGVLDNAAARFPHESYPFLKLCRMLACADGDGKFDSNGDHYITFRLKSMKTFTNLAVGQFERYHTIHEDENANLVELDQHTHAFTREVGLLTQGKPQSTALIIPAETEGEVISDSNPPVIKWKFEYCGLHLIGEWLELYYNGALHEVISTYEDPVSIVSETILLLTNLLTTTHTSKHSNRDAVHSILEEVSDNLNFGSNVVGLIFDIMEQDIQAYKRKPISTHDTSVLYATVMFARAVLKVEPSQFWRHIAKTSVASEDGLLSAVVLGNESVSIDTSVTLAVAELYSETITACLLRPLATGKSTLQRNDERLYEKIMLGLTHNMLDVLDSVSQWKQIGRQKQKLVACLTENFARILYLRYSVGAKTSRLMACLGSAAQMIMDHLRPETVGDAKSGPVLSLMLDTVQLRQTFVSSAIADQCFNSLLLLSRTLVDTARNQSLPACGLEHCLLDLAPVLVRHLHLSCPSEVTLITSGSYSAPRLLCSLISSLSTVKATSLLGYLGSESAIDTINILASSPPDGEFLQEAWRLLTHVINRDQQWLSIVILTGSLPDRKGRETTNGNDLVYRGERLVDKALTLLTQVNHAEGHLTQAVLRFMITAQQNWSWTLDTLRSRADVFTSLVKFATNPPGSRVEVHNFTVALVTDFCSVYLQFAKSTRDRKMADTVVPLIEWLARKAIDIKSYNTSVHANLLRNFESKFGLSLDEFRTHTRSSIDTNYYDSAVIDTVLASNPAWTTSDTIRRQSETFKHAVDTANANLFQVDSELTLLKSFQSLLLEHAAYFVELDSLKNTLAPIARRCMEANSDSKTRAPVHLQLFDSLLQSRAETTLSLMQQLLRVKTAGSEVRELLKVSWESCLLENSSYEKAMVNEDLTYWRTSLNVTLLALQFHLGKTKSAWKPMMSVTGEDQQSAAAELLKHTTNIHVQVVEIGRVVVGQGLDTIVSTILEAKQAELQLPTSQRTDDEESSETLGVSDLRLILNFLTSILRHPRLPEFQAPLAQVLIDAGAIQSALRLYSFSHLLTSNDTNHDPVHGEIALRILVGLSSLSECASELAIDGVLSQLLTARVTTALQRMPEGVSNLDTRPHCSSLYVVWSQGILPLVLNLLNAVGGTITPEISNFLNAFPSQLRKLSGAFQPRPDDGQNFLTLALAKEVSTMSLISFILEDYRHAGASAAVDPSMIQALRGFDDHKAGLVSDLRETLALNKDAMMRKIVPTTAAEEAMGEKLVDQVSNELSSAVACLTNGEGEA